MFKIKPLFFGIITASLALVAETSVMVIFGINELPQSFYTQAGALMVTFATIEEILKYAIIKKYYLTAFDFAIRDAATVGIGFALVEIGLNISGTTFFNLWTYGMLLGIFFFHFFSSSFVGWRLSQAKDTGLLFSLKTVFFTSFLHFLYNIAIIRIAQ
jgi:hypothetical protein